MRSSLRRATGAAAALLIGVSAALVPAGAASAEDPGARPGDTRVEKTVEEKKDGEIQALVHYCAGAANPAPQYSTAGGGYGTIHYGYRVQCSLSGWVHIDLHLYRIVGTGDRTQYQERDRLIKDGTGTVVATNPDHGIVVCLNNSVGRYIMSAHVDSHLGRLEPYPGWSSVKTFACGDVL